MAQMVKIKVSISFVTVRALCHSEMELAPPRPHLSLVDLSYLGDTVSVRGVRSNVFCVFNAVAQKMLYERS